MLLRLAIALAVLAFASGLFVLWKRPPRRRLSRISLGDIGVDGPAIVQFSTEFCAPCKTARPRLLEAARDASVEYAQVDLGERPDVARRYGIRTVPTIVVAAATGRVVGVWTRLPQNGEITEAARRASAAWAPDAGRPPR